MPAWLVVLSVLAAPGRGETRFERFQQDLAAIQVELHVPGMAVAVVESGRVVWRNDFGDANVSGHIPVTRATQFPIASVTKTMTSVVMMQLVEQKKLVLTEKLRRQLSHTSDGTVGEEFLYNSAVFNSLTPVVQKAAGVPFGDLLHAQIFAPLGMEHTTSVRGARNLATPYALDQGTVKVADAPGGSISAASGVVSTTGDLAKYAIALDGTKLVSAKSKALMFAPTRSPRGTLLPYGLGWFTQTYLGERMVWHYGQEATYSSLFLRVPTHRLTLIVLANSSTMSDASRLLDGNIARSIVANAFFKDVLFPKSHAAELERDEMIDRALLSLYLGRRDESAATVRAALEKFPEMESSGELTLLGLFARLGLPQSEGCATRLLKEHPYSPPGWFYYGTFLENAGRFREAAAAFEHITNHQPPWHHWSVAPAREELKKLQ